MTWGSKLAGSAGPHTAQVQVVVSQDLSADAKKAIATGLFDLLEPFAPKASSQICFVSAAAENLAIDGLMLPDLIARDGIRSFRCHGCPLRGLHLFRVLYRPSLDGFVHSSRDSL